MSPTGTGRKLVIVESPAKAKTIAGYLGPDWDVEASVGHIRDIPTPSEMPADMKKGPFGRFGVDVDNDFEPYYVVDSDKKKKVAELKRLLKGADELYLATDEDREGEAIAWHLLETLQPKVPVKRMVFHEITKEAIQRAAANTRDLDTALVDAQETRRILDRLYGYEISPVLWRKVKAGLSAGRVQSVTTRMVVERERERMAFRSANYWDVEGEFTPDAASSAFTARLSQVDGKRVATGRDFGDDGRLKGEVAHLDEAAATGIAHAVMAADVTVVNVAEKPYTRRPSAPFTTSTLQQEASRKLRLSSKNAMRVAQRLYENGYITYMRTDSTALSQSALTAARQQARDLYGGDYVPDAPRNYAKKVKNAQEAHEAIRPAGDRFRTPAQVAGEIRGDEFALYELIWKRTIASQMADAKGSTATVKLGATLDREAPAEQVEFTASGTVITFRGFMAAYEEGRDEQRNANADEERRLPRMGVGTELKVIRAEADGHDTSPPARYTEATLVKAMEEKGIGRPSTYASTIGTIQDRGYVSNRGNALVPSWIAFAVTRLMEEHFTRLVDYDFTASMEEDLDQIANGDAQRATWLKRFYFGDEATSSEGLRDLVADLGDIDARAISTIDIGDGIVVRVGRYGPYVEEVAPAGVDPVTGEVSEAYAGDAPSADGSTSDGAEGSDKPATPRRATINDDIAPDEMTPEKARELLATAADDGRVLGQEPGNGRDIVAKAGRYGPYVTEVLDEETAALKGKAKVKPRTASLFADMDLATLDLDTALKLLSLPRVVGMTTDKVTGEDGKETSVSRWRSPRRTVATVPTSRRAPTRAHSTSEQQLFDITLAEAEAIYAKPKQRGRAAAKPPLKEFGPDPVSGKPVVVKDGRFGEYVTDGETNTTLRRDDDLETMTAARAFEMLAEKRAKGPTTRKRAAKKTVKKAATKKTAAKKTAAKKTTAKKAAKKA